MSSKITRLIERQHPPAREGTYQAIVVEPVPALGITETSVLVPLPLRTWQEVENYHRQAVEQDPDHTPQDPLGEVLLSVEVGLHGQADEVEPAEEPDSPSSELANFIWERTGAALAEAEALAADLQVWWAERSVQPAGEPVTEKELAEAFRAAYREHFDHNPVGIAASLLCESILAHLSLTRPKSKPISCHGCGLTCEQEPTVEPRCADCRHVEAERAGGILLGRTMERAEKAGKRVRELETWIRFAKENLRRIAEDHETLGVRGVARSTLASCPEVPDPEPSAEPPPGVR